MKKYIGVCLAALATITTISSCTKKVDVVAVSAILPPVELSSLGMFTAGPYALPTGTTVNAVQVIFGATTTNKTPGAFDVVITDATSNATVETLHFPTWSGVDTFNTPSMGSISYSTAPTSYPNTTIYQGSILLKYTATAPFVTGHLYTVKATASTNDSTTPSTLTVAKLIAIQ